MELRLGGACRAFGRTRIVGRPGIQVACAPWWLYGRAASQAILMASPMRSSIRHHLQKIAIGIFRRSQSD